MAHMMKHTRSAVGHMFAHYDRSANNISNEKIDWSKTGLNYNLAEHHELSQLEFLQKRLSEVHCQNRKDVNVMVSWVLTAPKSLSEEEHEKFFKESYKFFKNRYGEENVISAYVHNDESQPHMHFSFVPVVYDKKRERFKVSAKEKVNRADLRDLHQDLNKYLENIFGRDVGVLNEATKGNNKTIKELKAETKANMLSDVEEKLLKRKKVAEENIQKLNETIKDCEVAFSTIEEIEQICPQKTITGAIKGVTVEEIVNLQETTKSLLKASMQFKMIQKQCEVLELENKKLKKQVPTIKQRSHYASLESENNKLEDLVDRYQSLFEQYREKNKEYTNILNDCIRAFSGMPDDVREQYEPQRLSDIMIKQKSRPVTKTRDFGMER